MYLILSNTISSSEIKLTFGINNSFCISLQSLLELHQTAQLMPFFIINKPRVQLQQYLNRRKTDSTPIEGQNEQTETKNDFFTRSRSKFRRTKRFNTSLGERCDIDFRIETLYQPSTQYTFNAEYFKTKYSGKPSTKLIKSQTFDVNQDSKLQEQQSSGKHFPLMKSLKNKILSKSNNKQSQTQYGQFTLTKSQIIPQSQQSQYIDHQQRVKSLIKWQIKKPTPVKEAQFLVKLKKNFLKRHGLSKKQKKSTKNDLIKIEDCVSENKQIFKRRMQKELIRSGEAKLISQFKQQKGKIYLSGLHNISKKKKSVQNIDQLLRKSRGSFSTPNTLIAHLKLTTEKKNKLQNIKHMNQQNMDNFLEKIKSLNVKSEMIASVTQGN